ncbi:MAG TPA: SRPBCC family protein [Polyangia bacterium]|jgi:hypothetical protein|nr:SRPBCC family protein [Polyangia bacterium]
MLRTVVPLLVAAVAVLAVVIATRPDSFRIARSATINAPASVVFALLNDFHQWVRWSPWEGRDPNLQRTYAGAASGEGAVYSWVGNSKVGEGRMTITESQPATHLGLTLEFFKPWQATNQTDFTLDAAGGETTVNWAMSGKSNFMHKAFSLLMNMDKMVGNDFEQGLANMKRIAEEEAGKAARP